jgi:predicted esterase YcpF (UPF0227 family)
MPFLISTWLQGIKMTQHNNIYYVHGYLSSPDGTKAQLFKKELNAIPIKYRDVPADQLVIDDCLMEISKIIHDETPCLIG